jgi:ABC-type antimicrobial peptide transport system permease subunit
VVAIVAVAGIVAAFTFGASLDRLTNTPARYGWTASVAVETFDNSKEALLTKTVANHEYRSVALLDSGQIRVGNVSTDGYALDVRKGALGFTMLAGRMPEAPDEVAIGPALQAELATTVGGAITVTAPHNVVHHMRVVGIDLAPESLGDSNYSSYSSSVVLTRQTFDLTATAAGQPAVLIRYATDADAARLSDVLARNNEVITPVEPAAVSNLGQLGRLPDFLIAFLALLGAIVLGHALVATTRRRRSEFAVLRTVGFRTRQLRASVVFTAVTGATIGLAVGIPIGLAVGNAVWRAVAHGVDVARDTAIPWTDLALLAVSALLLLVALAALTARTILQTAPARDLRAE